MSKNNEWKYVAEEFHRVKCDLGVSFINCENYPCDKYNKLLVNEDEKINNIRCNEEQKDEYGNIYCCVLQKDHIGTHQMILLHASDRKQLSEEKEYRKKTVTTKYTFNTGDLKRRLGIPEECNLSYFKYLGDNAIDEGWWELYLDEEESDF